MNDNSILIATLNVTDYLIKKNVVVSCGNAKSFWFLRNVEKIDVVKKTHKEQS